MLQDAAMEAAGL